MKLRALTAVAVAAFVFPAVAGAAEIYLADTIPRSGRSQVAVTVRKPAAFKILLRTSTQGRTRLNLLGAHSPTGGPLMDTKTMHCDGAAGSYYCRGSYEALPPGTYTFCIVYAGTTPHPADIELTVRW